MSVRLTDGANGPSVSEDATYTGSSFPVTVPCTATGATSDRIHLRGHDQLRRGHARGGPKSANGPSGSWARVEVLDEPDGVAATTPNTTVRASRACSFPNRE